MEPLLDCKIEKVELENPPQDAFKLEEQIKPILSMGK